ncbi:MAG: acyl carrier protein [Bacteroidales bacterium]
MTDQTIFDQLQQIFREVFENPTMQLSPTATAHEIENWDSMAHVGLIAAIEEHFGVDFDLDELIEMNSVGAILSALSAKINR